MKKLIFKESIDSVTHENIKRLIGLWGLEDRLLKQYENIEDDVEADKFFRQIPKITSASQTPTLFYIESFNDLSLISEDFQSGLKSGLNEISQNKGLVEEETYNRCKSIYEKWKYDPNYSFCQKDENSIILGLMQIFRAYFLKVDA